MKAPDSRKTREDGHEHGRVFTDTDWALYDPEYNLGRDDFGTPEV
jgi:hypothetical protein